jgi:serine/threonine protein kinase
VTEANTARLFTHPNIVRVHTIIRKNETAYMVMAYERGRTLTEVLQAGEKFDEQQLRDVILPLLDGVQMMHNQGFIHRDIKPSNIFIRTDRTPVLIDFGSARFALDDEPVTLTSFISPGYAPAEQYSNRGDIQGPWTDIYSLAATAYRIITGRRPDEALAENADEEASQSIWARLEMYSDDYSVFFLRAIEHALRPVYSQRPQTAADWRQMLTDPTYSFKRQRERERNSDQISPPDRWWKTRTALLAITIVILAVLSASIYLLSRF